MYHEPFLGASTIIYVVICLYTPQPSLLFTVYVTTLGIGDLALLGTTWRSTSSKRKRGMGYHHKYEMSPVFLGLKVYLRPIFLD